MTRETPQGLTNGEDQKAAEAPSSGVLPRAALLGVLGIAGFIALALVLRVATGGAGTEEIEAWFGHLRDAPYAIFVVIGVFVTLSFAAAPQFGLVAACALVFGPQLGFLYSWIATMCGATLHFFLGDRFGSRALRQYGGVRTNMFSRKLGDHGILASALVRVVPTGPFVVVNVAAGVSHIPLWKFLLGTSIGTIPKTAVIAFVGGNLMDVIRNQRPQDIALIIGLLLLWLVLGLIAKRYLMPYLRKPTPVTDTATTVDPSDGEYTR
ncbi:MAG: TVP38/TMEM64 family protein [Pseudomonadota bacterium]